MKPGPSPAAASGRKQDSTRSDEIVVFWVRGDTACSDCGEALARGRFLRLDAGKPFCLSCADLDHLVFLASGDAALTRRARRYSTLSAVVVRFSRTRNRYERQGVLIEEEALARAEKECLSDAEARKLARERSAERRADLDARYLAAFARRMGELFPGCPPVERAAITEHACRKHSGRVGRTAAAKALEEDAVLLAVRAHIRHVHTPYDRLLARGRDRLEARAEVSLAVAGRLEAWRAPES
jgi:hypothetical protein